MIPIFLIVMQGTGGGGTTDPLPAIGYGALGAIFTASVFGYVWYKPGVNRVIAESDKKDVQIEKMQTVIEKVIPAMQSSDTLMESMKPLLADLVRWHQEEKTDREIGRRSSVRLRKEQQGR